MNLSVTFALQAATLAFALLMTVPASVPPTGDEPTRVIRTAAPAEAQRLHCRLYFGCAPVQRVSAESARD
jgi:hypothetical protein